MKKILMIITMLHMLENKQKNNNRAVAKHVTVLL